jgi:hypothetical protein
VTLPRAVRVWSPALGRHLDQVKWVSPDEIRSIGQLSRQREQWFDHDSSLRGQRSKEKLQRAQDTGFDDPSELARTLVADLAEPGIPEALHEDWVHLLHEWNQMGDADRLVRAFELVGHLIIEKTKAGQPYALKYAPLATEGLGAAYQRVGDARHDALGPYDFDIRNSAIRNPGGNWLPAQISGGADAEAERMRRMRLQRDAEDNAAAAFWATILARPFRQRSLFNFAEVAEHLTRRSIVQRESAKRNTVVLDLDDWTRRQEFDLSGESDVVMRIEGPPFFRPVGPADIGNASVEPEVLKIHNAQFCYLRRPACRRYIEANLSLENAPQLLRDWFPETSPPASPPSSDGAATPARRGAYVNARLRAALLGALKTLGCPGSTIQWKPFCDRIRDECQATTKTRGYSDKSIQRAVTTIKAEQDKKDKLDMSDMS